jgi:hypothetical protein
MRTTSGRQHRVEARGEECRAAGLRFLFVAGLHDAQDLLLVRPDQHPHVEQHDGAEPGADADGAHAVTQQEGVDELRPEECGAGDPGHHGGPAEEQQCARGDVLGDARSSAIGAGIFQRRHLHEVEVIEQADPHDACHEMNPAGQRGDDIDIFHCDSPFNPKSFWQRHTTQR